MERVRGIKITEKAALEAAGLDPADVVQDLMRVYVRMILAAGFFQADPHPGNLMVTPDAQAHPARLRPLEGAARGLRPRPVRADVLDDDAERVGDGARLPGARLRDEDRRHRHVPADRAPHALAQRDGRVRGRVHRGDDGRAVRGDPPGPGRAGAERLRAGRAACSRSSPASRTRSARARTCSPRWARGRRARGWDERPRRQRARDRREGDRGLAVRTAARPRARVVRARSRGGAPSVPQRRHHARRHRARRRDRRARRHGCDRRVLGEVGPLAPARAAPRSASRSRSSRPAAASISWRTRACGGAARRSATARSWCATPRAPRWRRRS